MIPDLDKILKSNFAHRIIKRAGKKLQKEMYYTPSRYFRQLTDHDSEILGEWSSVISDVDIPDSEKDDEYQQLILLSQILSMAEGVYTNNDEDDYQVLKRTVVMCIANDMHRKGLVKCFYDNLTYGVEGDDLNVMERL